MGLYDRDYIRASGEDWGGGQRDRYGGPRSATQQLIAVNVAVFLVQLFSSSPMRGSPGLTPFLCLDPMRPWELWRIVTGGFCHDISNLWGLLFAMVVLWWAGREVELRLGYRRMLAFYLAAEVTSSISYLAYARALGSTAPAVGSAGAVMAVFVLLALHAPRIQVLLFFVLPIEIRWLAIAYVAMDLVPLVEQWFAGRGPWGVAHGVVAHVGVAHVVVAHVGRLGGAAFALAYFRWAGTVHRAAPRSGGRSWVPGWLRRAFRRPSAKGPAAPVSRFTLVEPVPRDDFELEVDRLLAKIAAAGEESLSPEERLTLVEASRRYREKQNK